MPGCRKLCSSDAAAAGRVIPHTCMASASPCRAPVLWRGSYTGVRAASVRQREAEPSPGVMLSPAVLWRPSRRALHARGSPWGIAAPACKLNSAPARSARGLAACRAARGHASAIAQWPGNLLFSGGAATLTLASEHRQGKGRRKGFWCPPRSELRETELLTSLVEGRVGLSIPAAWPAGCTEAHRAGPCANLLSVLQGAGCVHPRGPVRGCCLLEAVSSPGVRPQAAALAVGVLTSPDPGGLRPPSLHRPCFTG